MRRYSALLLTLALLAGPAAAKTWTTSGTPQFAAGKLEGVSVRSTGELQLAPPAEEIEGLEADFVWDIELADDGTAYVGTGSPGAVYRLSAGRLELLHKDEKLHVLSVLPMMDGSVLAGTAPEGVILRISRRGQVTTFADLQDLYVWDMAFSRAHRIYCATGPEGRLYELNQGGDATELLKVPQQHLMCVAVDGGGTVYAGSAPDGLVYAVDEQDRSSVLYDAEEDEVHDIVVDPEGVVYACTAQGEQRGGRRQSSNSPDQQPEPPPGAQLPLQGTPKAFNSIYRIEPGQGASRLARYAQVFVLSLGLFDDRVLAGTGPGGRLMSASADHEMVVDQFGPAHVTAIAVTPEGEAVIGTANSGELWYLDKGFRVEGTYLSKPFDAGYLSRWGSLWWEQNVTTGQNVRIRLRTGNSGEPDDHWSEWSRWSTSASGESLDVPMGRFAQFGAELSTHPGTGTPSLWEINVSYRQANRKPRIEDIALDGTSLLKPENGNQGARSRRPQRSGPSSGSQNNGPSALLKLEWKVADPNEDELAFDVFYRGLDETEWKTLEKDIRDKPALQWDTSRVPDGLYLVRIVARDDVARPADEALSAERITPPILIDNRPPAVLNLQSRRLPEGRFELTGRARDEFSPISEIAVSRNSGDWRSVFPDDGILDSPEEAFSFRSDELEAGEHVFVFAATDENDNTGSAKIVVSVPE